MKDVTVGELRDRLSKFKDEDRVFLSDPGALYVDSERGNILKQHEILTFGEGAEDQHD